MFTYKIYYTDGSIISDPIDNAPTIGIIGIVERSSPTQRTIFHSLGYYVYTRDGIVPLQGYDGVIDLILHDFNSIIRVFQGRGMANKEFYEIYERMKLENP